MNIPAHFSYNAHNALCIENIALQNIAERFGTPAYVYSKAQLTSNYLAYSEAFAYIDHQVCYAVKANSNLAVLQVLAKLGSGFDIVSGGELARVIAAGGDPSKVVFSGLAKTEQEITEALRVNIACFNVESRSELARINTVAAGLNTKARVSLRVNPNVDAATHPYISTGLKENKFGIPFDEALATYQYAATLGNLDVVGIDCHIGSQLTNTTPFVDALAIIQDMIAQLAAMGITLSHIDIGGGLGVCYKDETPPTPAQYANAIAPLLQAIGLKVYLEPGRSIIANAGVLLTKVDFLKPTAERNFAIVDAAMNDLIRPALYSAWMDIVPVQNNPTDAKLVWDIVGGVCETADFLGKERLLALQANDVLAVLTAGAYGFVMSSQYNTRPRACELMVDGNQVHVVREREALASLWQLEHCLP